MTIYEMIQSAELIASKYDNSKMFSLDERMLSWQGDMMEYASNDLAYKDENAARSSCAGFMLEIYAISREFDLEAIAGIFDSNEALMSAKDTWEMVYYLYEAWFCLEHAWHMVSDAFENTHPDYKDPTQIH